MSVIDKLTGNDDISNIEFSEVGFAIIKERLHASVQRANLAIIIIAGSAVLFLGVSQWAVSNAQEAADDAKAAAQSVSEETLEDVDDKLGKILESRKESTGKFKALHKKSEERDEELKDEIEEDMEKLEKKMDEGNEINRMILKHLLEMQKGM